MMKLALNKRVIGIIILGLFILFLNDSLLGQSIEFDKKMGAENHELVKTTYGIYEDETLTNYVNSIGQIMVKELDDNPFEFQFHIADDFVPNAFALPGGYVYVTRGLLTLANREDELACVIAHEIIHVVERHSIKQLRKSIFPRLLEIPGEVVGDMVDDNVGTLINAPVTVSNSLIMSSYSRKQEREADADGIVLAAKVGYNPNALMDILERLSKTIEVITEEEEKKSYFDSHPYTPDRVERLNELASEIKWDDSPGIAKNFPLSIDGMIFGENPKQGLFVGQAYFHPDLNFTLSFPEEWITSNQPTYVYGINEDRNAGIFLGLESPEKTPKEHGKEFETNFEREYGRKPDVSETRMVNGHTGYLISFEDNSGYESMNMHVLWLSIDNKVFELIGFAPDSPNQELRKTVLSLQELKPEDRSSLEFHKVKIVKAKKGETMEEIGVRTNNVLDTELTCLINEVGENEKLENGQLIKIVIKEKYFK